LILIYSSRWDGEDSWGEDASSDEEPLQMPPPAMQAPYPYPMMMYPMVVPMMQPQQPKQKTRKHRCKLTSQKRIKHYTYSI
jgi:hypothetical protein